MNKFIALLSVVVASSVVASAETLLNVTLTPALDCSHANALFLRVTTPEPVQNYACVQTCVVNEPCEKMGVGSFVADLRYAFLKIRAYTVILSVNFHLLPYTYRSLFLQRL